MQGNKAIKIISCLALACLSYTDAWLQVDFTPRYFKGRKEELTLAKKYLAEAEKMEKRGWEEDRSFLKLALDDYLHAAKINPDNAPLNFSISRLYYELGWPVLGLDFLEKVKNYDPLFHPLLDFYLAEAWYHKGEIEKAEQLYLNFRKNYHAMADRDYLQMSIERLGECETYEKLRKNMTRMIFTPVDSLYGDLFMPCMASYDLYNEMFYYTTVVDTLVWKEKMVRENLHDSILLYQRGRRETITQRDTPHVFGTLFPVSFSYDGEMALYKDISGDLYLYHTGDSVPQRLPDTVNTIHDEKFASFHYKPGVICFSSDRPGGYGGYDLYLWDGKNVQNLGPEINSIADELYAHFHPDRKTVYFSSNGYNTLGGFDIFSTTYENEAWTSPENIGYPVNSTGDEMTMYLHPDGRKAFFLGTRWENGTYHGAWSVEILGAEKEPVPLVLHAPYTFPTAIETFPLVQEEPCLNCSEVAALRFAVTVPGGHVVTAELCFHGENISDSVQVQTPVSWLSLLPTGEVYRLSIRAEGYLPFTEILDMTEEKSYTEVASNIVLTPLGPGQVIRLTTVGFNSNSSDLQEYSLHELEALKTMLENYPGMVIRLGVAGSNTSLNKSRLEKLKKYFTDEGVSSKRVLSDKSDNPSLADFFTEKGYWSPSAEYVYLEIVRTE